MTRLGGIALVAAVVLALVLPHFLKAYGLYLISMWAVLTIAVLGLNLTLGYAGQVSLAQGAFVGIGAYTVALLMQAGWPFPLTFICAALLCFGIGWGLGYPALRVQHHYLAFITLAFNTLVFLLLRNEEWLTHGIYGVTGIMRPVLIGWSTSKPLDYYYFCVSVLTLVAGGLWWMIRSPWGRAFVALRENPIRALSLGLDTRRYTLMAFAIGSSLGGVSGALYAPLVQFIEPNSFALGLSFNLNGSA
jgi:branched-chain amino acid transport system permease protein